MSQDEIITLDPRRYFPENRRWEVPLLRVRSINCRQIFLGDLAVPESEYQIAGHHIIFSREVSSQIDLAHRNSMLISFDSSDYRTAFWLPIILAIIGLVGAVSQPILHYAGLLYVQPTTEVTREARLVFRSILTTYDRMLRLQR